MSISAHLVHRSGTGRVGLQNQEGETLMRFMVIVKANKDSESGKVPDEKTLTEMGEFNEQLVRAGVMVAAEGLQASSNGARVKFDGSRRTVIDGPFAETKDLVAGFWIWELKSKDQAIEWLKRAPFQDEEVEIRQLFESADFAPRDPTGELIRKEEELRKIAESRRN
jgi:hypothetical protein